MSPRELAAVLLLALAVAGCGGDDRGQRSLSGAYHLQPLDLQPPEGSAPPSQPVQVARVAVPKDLAGWEVKSARSEVLAVQVETTEAGAQRAPALVMHDTEVKEVRIPVDFDSNVNEVVLVARTMGRETVQVMCENSGRVIVSSPALVVDASPLPRAVSFELPRVRRTEATFDALRVRIESETRSFVLVEAVLHECAPASFLPSPGAPELVTLRRDEPEGRRGVGLVSGAPLTGAFRVPTDGGELAFSFGLIEDLRIGGDAPALEVELSVGGQAIRERYELESVLKRKARWHEAQIDLSDFAGRDVRARFELVSTHPKGALGAIAEPRVRRAGANAPTVLLVTSDTHRGDHIGSAGPDAPVHTPVLDALAARGVLFENCYSATNVTNPSHVSLMTGLSPRDTRVISNNLPLAEEAPTLAEAFHAAGFRTFAALSAHHLMDHESGLGQGFDRMSAPRLAQRDGSETIDVLEAWLDEAEGEPLFVWLHVFDAHAPYEPPAPFDRRYYPEDRDPYGPEFSHDLPDRLLPKFLKGLRDVDFPYQQYRAEVDYLDSLMERVFARPRVAEGVIAFTSDHGESFGQHGVWWDHAELYPDSVHVPLIMAWPGGPAGARVSHPVSALDVARTLLDLAGSADAPFGGRDLRAALDPDFSADARFLLSFNAFSAAVNTGRWHLILHLKKHHQTMLEEGRELHQVELYDVEADPECLRDLVAEETDVAARLRERLVRWLVEAHGPGLVGSAQLTRENVERLAALGYAASEGEPTADALFDPECTCQWCARFAP